jgi:hypothetical protein
MHRYRMPAVIAYLPRTGHDYELCDPTIKMIERGLRRSRCVVDSWCDLENLGAETTVRSAAKTGELLISFPGRFWRNLHQSSMPPIRQQHANQ